MFTTRHFFFALWALSSAGLMAQNEPWLDVSFSGRVGLSNLSPVGGQALTDFPVLIRLTNQGFLKQAAASDGGDICFSGVDGYQLFHEIEDYDRVAGNLTAWVCLPTFTNKTRLLMYYGNTAPLMTFRGSNTTGSLNTNVSSFKTRLISTNVWDSAFRLVLHFGETSGSPADSSRYGLVPAAVGTSNIPGSNGFIGRYLTVDLPTADYSTTRVPLRYAYNNFPSYPSQVSISLWLNSRSPIGYVGNGLYMGPFTYFGGGSGNGILGMKLYFDGTPTVTSYAVATTPSSFPTNRWTYLALAAGLATIGPSVTNGTNICITNGVVAKSNTSPVTMIQNYNPTADLTLGGSTGGWASMPGLYDEIRLSHTNRGIRWLFTEHSNTLLADTNLFYVVGNPEPGPLMSRLSNEITSPLPYAGGLVNLFLDPASVSIPYRGSNFITNIYWLTTNHSGLGYSTNIIYGNDTNEFKWTLIYGAGGLYSNYAVLTDLSNGVWTNAALARRIYSNANYALGNFSVRQTNQGVLLDLFGADNALSRPISVSVWRDGSSLSPRVVGSNLFLDDDFLFYNKLYDYQVVAQFPEAAFSNSATVTGVTPGAVTNWVGGSGNRTVSDFEILATFPENVFQGPLAYTLRRPSDQMVCRWQTPAKFAYGEFLLEGGPGAPGTLSRPVGLRYAVQVVQGNLKIPGYNPQGLAPLTLEDRFRLSLATWDGNTWRALPSRLTARADRVLVEVDGFQTGRFGLVLSEGATGSVGAGPFLGSRLLVPGSTDGARSRLSLFFFRADGEAVSFTVLNDRGRTVYENRAVSGNQIDWDLRQDGQYISPGIYIYLLRVGTSREKETRGTFVVGYP